MGYPEGKTHVALSVVWSGRDWRSKFPKVKIENLWILEIKFLILKQCGSLEDLLMKISGLMAFKS
jgi:hypothetical protein